MEQLNRTLDVYKWQNELQSTEIAKLRQSTANLQEPSRLWYASEYKNIRKQLAATSLSKSQSEKSLATEIAKLKRVNEKLREVGDATAKFLHRDFDQIDSKSQSEKSLTMEISRLKRENQRLREKGERAALILRRAPRRTKMHG